MSASNKKKLRKEQESAKLTEKQLTAQKEAKKVSLYTTCFVAAMVVLLVVAIVIGVNQTISSHGVREKKTVALVVDDHQITNAELNYFYMDAVNNFYNTYGAYAAMFGLDASTPLNEQVTNEETGATWADDFLNTANTNAKSAYALADAAKAAGFTLSETQQATLSANLSTLDLYAQMYGYSSGEAYLKAVYGNGATKESYQAYVELITLADAYQTHYAESLTYTDADLRAVDGENFQSYSSYNYNTYYLAASKFLEGGTTGEDGATTYTDQERAAAVAAAEEAAKALTSDEIATVEDLDAAIAALSVNEGKDVSSTLNENKLYTSLNNAYDYSEWVLDSSRKAGDKTYIASTSTSTDEAGNETTTTDGYYVVYFTSSNDNTFALKNARHILVPFAGGTQDETTGTTTYSDEEKAAAKTEAEEILADWKAGEATEDSFATLANEKSADGDGTTGGLYENIYPGQMVQNFNDWCFDETRKAGDTGIVETEYGYHVMYFVGDAQLNYRDYLITNELRDKDVETWYNGLVEASTMTVENTSYIRKDLVLKTN